MKSFDNATPFQKEYGTDLLTYLKQKAEEAGRPHTINVATHSGAFHADECLAIAALEEALPDYSFCIVRTRDPETLAKADICTDVGDGLFDHHSADTTEYYLNRIQIAACGKILREIEPDRAMRNNLLCQMFYAVCAQDTGLDFRHLPSGVFPPKLGYVASYNQTWEEKRDARPNDINSLFLDVVEKVREDYARCRKVCKAALSAAHELQKCPQHFNGRFIELSTGAMHWLPMSYAVPDLLGAVYPDESIPGNWVIRMAPVAPGSMELKVAAPTEWCGRSGDELVKISRIPGIVFCHKSGFLVTVKTRGDAFEVMDTINNIYERAKHEKKIGVK